MSQSGSIAGLKIGAIVLPALMGVASLLGLSIVGGNSTQNIKDTSPIATQTGGESGVSSDIKSVVDLYTVAYWFGVPIIVYILAIIGCLIVQLVECGTTQFGIIIQNSWQVLLFVFFGLGVAEVSLFRAPVVTVYGAFTKDYPVGINDILRREEEDPLRLAVAQSYFLFWGAVIGQVFTIGASTICKS